MLIRPLRAEDLPAADSDPAARLRHFPRAAGPHEFRGDASPVRTRYLADPAGCFAAELDGELVGTNFAVDWGSVGFFGPLTVHPDLWGRGIAQRLVEAALEVFARRGTRHVGLFTFAHSPKHLALYQKFGFWPRFPTADHGQTGRSGQRRRDWSAYSALPAARQRALPGGLPRAGRCVHRGLDLGREITRHRAASLRRDGAAAGRETT